MKKLFRVTGINLCAGFEVENDKVIRAAPIFHYSVGWPFKKALKYFQGRGFFVEECSSSLPCLDN